MVLKSSLKLTRSSWRSYSMIMVRYFIPSLMKFVVDMVKEKLGIAPVSESESEESSQHDEQSDESEDIKMVEVKTRKIVKVARKAQGTAAANTKKTRAATLPPVKVEVKYEPAEESLIGKKRKQPPQKLNEIQSSPKAKAKKVASGTRKAVKVEVKTESSYRQSSS